MAPPSKILYHFRVRGVGVERIHIAGMAAAFEELGHHVDFVSPTGANPLEPESHAGKGRRRSALGAFADRIPQTAFALMEISYNLYSLFAIWKRMRSNAYVALYERYAFFGFSATVLARLRGVKIVIEVNELSGFERVREQRLTWLARIIEGYVFSRADLVVCVSEFLKDHVMKRSTGRANAAVIPNAVGRSFLQPDPEREREAKRLRDSLGLTDRLVIGYLGSIVAWHRFDILLEAFANLAAQNERICLLMVGDGPLREQLAQTIRRGGLEDRVVFTGNVAHDRAQCYVRAFDVAVVPNSNEYRSPVKMFEYMALARCVVVPDCRPVLDVVEDGRTGLIFRTGDPASLQNALETALADGALRIRTGENARRAVEERYTWLHHAQNVLDLLRSTPGKLSIRT